MQQRRLWQSLLFMGLFFLYACGGRPYGTSPKRLLKHQPKSSLPYQHRTGNAQPYKHSSGFPPSHSTRKGNPMQHGTYGKRSRSKNGGSSSSGLGNYYCRCLLSPSDGLYDQTSYYVCARDPIDAESFSSYKCITSGLQVCTGCVCIGPSVDCIARGN